jgi:hypothetical protein
MARLEARQAALKAFQGKGRLTFLSPERNYSGACLLSGQIPDTLRVDVRDILGRSLLSLSASGQQMQVLFPQEGKLFKGRATPKLMAVFLPPTVTLPQAVRLLAGALPLSQGQPSGFRLDEAQSCYVLEWSNATGGPQERLWVEAASGNPVRSEWHGDGPELKFSADLVDYGQLATGLPGKVTVKTANPQMELRLTYQELRLNPPLPAQHWDIEPPPGVAVLRLDKE